MDWTEDSVSKCDWEDELPTVDKLNELADAPELTNKRMIPRVHRLPDFRNNLLTTSTFSSTPPLRYFELFPVYSPKPTRRERLGSVFPNVKRPCGYQVLKVRSRLWGNQISRPMKDLYLLKRVLGAGRTDPCEDSLGWGRLLGEDSLVL